MKATINEIDIDYRDQGSGLPVILIHAFPLDQRMWDDQIQPLGNICRVITLDLRGLGESGAPSAEYSLTDMASDVRGLMRRLSIDRAVLVGLSMGGYVSMAFYREYPDGLLGLVLSDTRIGADTEEGRARRFASAKKAEQQGAAAIAADIVPVLLGRTSIDQRPRVVERVTRMAESNSPRGIACAQRAMANRPDSRLLMASAGFPVLLICGEEDTLSPPAEMEEMQRGIPGATLKVIERAGHLPNMEQPDKFNSILSGFIASFDQSAE